MGILDRLFGKKSADAPEQPPRDSAGVWRDWLDMLNFSPAGENPYVYRCKDLRATAVSSLHPILMDADGNEIEGEHPIKALFAKPNDRSTWRQLMYDIQIDIATTGNAYIMPFITIKGVTELWRIPPERVAFTETGDIFHPVGKWIVTSGEAAMYIDPERFIHIHTQLGPDMIRGISPLEAAGLSIQNQNEAREWNSSLLNNGAKPTLIIETDKEMLDWQYQEFKARISANNGGKGNAGKVMVLDDGKKATTAGFSATDMDFSNGIVLSAREIAVAFGVPPENVGDSANKTYANAQEANKEFAMHTVMPLADMVYEALTTFIRKFHKDFDHIGYDKEEIDGLKGDTTTLLTALNGATFLTVNEKRARLSYDAVEGGDVILQPLGQAPLSEVATDIGSLMGDKGES